MRHLLIMLSLASVAVLLAGCDKMGFTAPSTPPDVPNVPAAPKPDEIPPAGTPERTVRDFHDGLQSGDLSNIRGLVAYDLATVPSGKVLTPLREAARQLSTDTTDFRILETKIDGDCAVVVVHVHIENGQPSTRGVVEPYYVLRQNGMWRLLPMIGHTDNTTLTPEQKQVFERLKKWFWDTKPALVTKAKATK